MEHIEKMESILNQQTALLAELNQALQRLDDSQADYQQLMDYYGSEQYLADVDRSNRGEFADLACGVLSEDAVYDLFTERSQLSIRLLELATQIVKEG